MNLVKEWSIEGKDLISEVTCQEPYEWSELTDAEWEFSPAAVLNAKNAPYHVSVPLPAFPTRHLCLAPVTETASLHSRGRAC